MLVPFTQAEHGIYRGDEVLNNQIFRVRFFFSFAGKTPTGLNFMYVIVYGVY